MGIRRRRQEMGEEAWALYQAKRKLTNVKKYQQNNSEKVIECRKRKKQNLVEYKGGRCERCGLESHIYDVYDFHHIDPSTKEFGLASLGKNFSFEKCKKEVDKCMLVCKNCHAIIHYELRLAKKTQNDG